LTQAQLKLRGMIQAELVNAGSMQRGKVSTTLNPLSYNPLGGSLIWVSM